MTRICVSWEETKKRLKKYRDDPDNCRDLRTYAHALLLIMKKLEKIEKMIKEIKRD